MNKIYIIYTLLTLTFTSTNAIAQKIGNFNMKLIYSSSLDSMERSSDSIASLMGMEYQLIEEKNEVSFWGEEKYLRIYKSSEGRILEVFISTKEIGGNPALEIPETKYYYISLLSGKYRDLFKIYEKLDPKADLAKISEGKQLSFVSLSPLFDSLSNDMIRFNRSISTLNEHKDIWSIMFLINDFLEHKANEKL